MCRGAAANLKAGGRFVAFTIDPAFDLRKSNWAKYGFEVQGERFEDGATSARRASLTEPPAPIE